MGFWDRIRGRRGRDNVVTSLTVQTGGGDKPLVGERGVTGQSQGDAVLAEIDDFMRSIVAMGAGGSSAAPTVQVNSTTTVFAAGRPFDAGDPRARAAVAEAVAKLRANGLDDLAAELERKLGSAAQPSAAPAIGEPLAAAAADDDASRPPTSPSPPSESL